MQVNDAHGTARVSDWGILGDLRDNRGILNNDIRSTCPFDIEQLRHFALETGKILEINTREENAKKTAQLKISGNISPNNLHTTDNGLEQLNTPEDISGLLVYSGS